MFIKFLPFTVFPYYYSRASTIEEFHCNIVIPPVFFVPFKLLSYSRAFIVERRQEVVFLFFVFLFCFLFFLSVVRKVKASDSCTLCLPCGLYRGYCQPCTAQQHERIEYK